MYSQECQNFILTCENEIFALLKQNYLLNKQRSNVSYIFMY